MTSPVLLIALSPPTLVAPPELPDPFISLLVDTEIPNIHRDENVLDASDVVAKGQVSAMHCDKPSFLETLLKDQERSRANTMSVDLLQESVKPGAGVELLDLGHGSYLVKFASLKDLEKVVTRGPWVVRYHYLTVRQWSPDFCPDSDHLLSTMAWVRLLALPLMYYDDDLLATFAKGIGKPIKIDSNTSQVSRALYAQICVEIDLTLPLVPVVQIREEVFKVQYEGLHVICMNCG
ncbi:hypothetical protein Tsubulata_021824 [Turnera subulata]|uniref:DUF4283 domain-containing protein n=1 Tax=Turnera subulata TaxID=218843 RepID=A0A9Q0GCH2_9ROSI|nr:hypothetical protein Tsubulata_021824 [Turnera subulata]